MVYERKKSKKEAFFRSLWRTGKRHILVFDFVRGSRGLSVVFYVKLVILGEREFLFLGHVEK